MYISQPKVLVFVTDVPKRPVGVMDLSSKAIRKSKECGKRLVIVMISYLKKFCTKKRIFQIES